jgi:hypothetical protein
VRAVRAAAAPAAAACKEGVGKFGGASARTFCGPAKAKVRIGGVTVSYAGGECSKSAFGWSINIGTVVLGTTSKPKPEYFGITVTKAAAGTYANQGVAVVHAGVTRSVLGTVVLKSGVRSGTFSGRVFGTRTTLTGSFSC